MPGVRVPDRQDAAAVVRMRQPGRELAANSATRRFIGATRLARNHQHDPSTHRSRPVESARQGSVRSGEIMAVQVHCQINIDPARPEITLPTFVDGC